ncbi:lactate utilization protein [Desulfonatronovibrio hydrogenovorans]|uniref:lactate utilization protein n=1 Tax=Desulfonatronovibrio hydrogenovorans TaxID=53245 RepID=UPI000490B228|nr:lactate utilization protein [Desulfonatronovibrio hydrogenovorans]
MGNELDKFWRIRLDQVKESLEENNFSCFVAEDPDEARKLVLTEVVARLKPGSVSWGGSATFKETGLYDALKDRSDMEILDTYDKSISPEASWERRRQALLCDLFITGTNALTEQGFLVNLDMIGNRVGALTFGPRNVLVLCGRNKVVADLDEAMDRIKDISAPANAMRLNKKTPCVKTAYCHDCQSPDRICNVWTITEKSFPKARIIVVLINRDMGL